MLHHGDLFDVLPTLPADSVDALATDPPYGIGFMGKEWDSFKPGVEARRVVPNTDIESDNPNLKGRKRRPASSPSSGEYDRSILAQREFQAWTERWAREVLRVLKPGAYGVVCGAPRAYHRMASGLEDAGFEIRDCLSWLYGQGFPKSMDVGKAIEKTRNDDVRPVCRFLRSSMEIRGVSSSVLAEVFECHSRLIDHWAARETDSQPTCPTWDQWLKLKNVLGFGDSMDTEVKRLNDRKGTTSDTWQKAPVSGSYERDPGGLAGERFSVRDNLIRELTSDEAKSWEGYGTALKPSWEPIILVRKSTKATIANNVQLHGVGALNVGDCRLDGDDDESIGRWPANVVLDEDAGIALDLQTGDLRASRFYYVAKPSREERDYGCESLPIRTAGEATDRQEGTDGLKSPRAGAGRTGTARNFHPTVKPVELMRWLVRLIAPPGGVVLDPFTGSGTTGMACRYELREFVGIEREAEYVAIAERRIGAVAPLFGGTV